MDTAAMPDTAGPVCSCCGKPLPPGHLAWDYPEPDPVVLLSEEERAEWVAVTTAQIMQVRELGNFIRVILPVPVEHDREATFGVWLVITERDEWQRVIAAASQGGEAWAGVRFAGRLVTAVPPWPSIFGVWTQALAPAPNKVPRLVHSVDPVLNAVLTRRWPEDVIRSARHTYAPYEMTGGPTRTRTQAPDRLAHGRRIGCSQGVDAVKPMPGVGHHCRVPPDASMSHRSVNWTDPAG